jgi:hypothetical protein
MGPLMKRTISVKKFSSKSEAEKDESLEILKMPPGERMLLCYELSRQYYGCGPNEKIKRIFKIRKRNNASE